MADFEKTPGEVIFVTAKWGEFLEYIWQKQTKQAINSYVRPHKFNGFEYQCTTAGYTGGIEPRWPTTLGATVQDGSAIWTCVAYNDQGTDTINTTTWTVPAPLSNVGTLTDFLNTLVKISGGTAGIYTLKNQIVTANGRTEEQDITLEVL